MDTIPQDTPQKQCTACLKFLPAAPEFFHRSRLGLYGLRSVCKQCKKVGKMPVKPDMQDGYKRCHKCRKVLPYGLFAQCKKVKDGLQRHCRQCGSTYEKAIMTPTKKRAKALRRYHITPEEYEQMLIGQSGVCACCGQTETRINPQTGKIIPLSVDHDHKTGKVRSLLCHECNVAYGSLKEDPNRIKALLRYAEWCQKCK